MDFPTPVTEALDAHADVRSLANGTGIIAAGTIAGRLIHVLTDIWFARLLGPEWFGIYSIGWNLHRLLSTIASLGIPSGTIVFGVKYWKKEPNKLGSLFQVAMISTLLSGLASALVLWFAADWLALVVFSKPEAAQTIRTVGLVMPFVLILGSAGSISRVTRRMEYSVIPGELVTTISMLLVFAGLYWLTGQFWAVLVSMVVSYILAAAVMVFFILRLFPEIRLIDRGQWAPSIKELLGFSIPTMLAGIFGVTDSWLNRVLTGVFFPTGLVGVYQAASQFNNLFAILMGSVVGAFMPFVASLYHSGEHQRLNELYKVTTKWSLYMNLPVVIVTLLMPTEIMNFFYGAKYTQGAGLLVILAIGQLINVGTGPTGGMFLMTGRQRQYLILTILSFCLNIFGSIALIPLLGISAMAVGQLLASLCDNIFGTLWLAYDAGVWPYDRRYFKGLLASLAMAAVVWWLPVVTSSAFWMLFMRAGLGLSVFVGTLLLTGLDSEDRTFLAELWRLTAQKLLPTKNNAA